MSYVDGFVIAVPTDAREAFIAHAKSFDALFMEYGALRIVECWADDVPEGEVTSFPMAVKREEGEAVVFAWIEWPDKATRDRAYAAMETDARFRATEPPMPFDGKRMIFGGFVPVLTLEKE